MSKMYSDGDISCSEICGAKLLFAAACWVLYKTEEDTSGWTQIQGTQWSNMFLLARQYLRWHTTVFLSTVNVLLPRWAFFLDNKHGCVALGQSFVLQSGWYKRCLWMSSTKRSICLFIDYHSSLCCMPTMQHTQVFPRSFSLSQRASFNCDFFSFQAANLSKLFPEYKHWSSHVSLWIFDARTKCRYW